jgi:hypothetical protein
MNANELRQMIRRSDIQPFVVHMDDGASYKVTHPDFALLAPGTLIIAASPGEDLGGSNFVLCLVSHISRLEVLKPKSKAK